MSSPTYVGTRYRYVSRSTAGLWPGLCIVGICIPFLVSGVLKAAHPSAAAAEVAGLGLPAATLLAWLTVIVQLVGSFATIWGRRPIAVLGALSLAGFTLLVTFAAHAFWRMPPALQTAEFNVFLEHLSIVGGLLFVAWCKWTAGDRDA
jgi:transmembrane protein